MQSDNKKQAVTEIPSAGPQLKGDAQQNLTAAHEKALSDIEADPELSIHNPNDDLDEGEMARLGEDKTDVV